MLNKSNYNNLPTRALDGGGQFDDDKSDNPAKNTIKLNSTLCMATSENLTASRNDKFVTGKMMKILEDFHKISSYIVGFAAAYFEPHIMDAAG